MSENQAESLASKLKGWNLRQHDTTTWYFRNRKNELKHFSAKANRLILGMMLVLLWTSTQYNSGTCS